MWTRPTLVGASLIAFAAAGCSAGPEEAERADAKDVLVSGLSTPGEPVVWGGSIYFADQLELRRVPSAGGAPETLAEIIGEFGRLAVDDEAVYFTIVGAARLVGKVSLDDGRRVVLVPASSIGGNGALGIAVRGSHVYWCEWGVNLGGYVARTPTAGGVTVELTLGDKTRLIALDDRFVYYTQMHFQPAEPPGGVFAVPLEGGEHLLLAEAERPFPIAVFDGEVFFVDFLDNSVKKVSRDGGGVTALGAFDSVGGIAVDASGVYAVAGPDQDHRDVVRIPLAGGETTVIARGQRAMWIALDETHVYWTNVATPGHTDGSIRRVKKPT